MSVIDLTNRPSNFCDLLFAAFTPAKDFFVTAVSGARAKMPFLTDPAVFDQNRGIPVAVTIRPTSQVGPELTIYTNTHPGAGVGYNLYGLPGHDAAVAETICMATGHRAFTRLIEAVDGFLLEFDPGDPDKPFSRPATLAERITDTLVFDGHHVLDPATGDAPHPVTVITGVPEAEQLTDCQNGTTEVVGSTALTVAVNPSSIPGITPDTPAFAMEMAVHDYFDDKELTGVVHIGPADD